MSSYRTKNRQHERTARPENGRFRVRYVFYFALALMIVMSIMSYSAGDLNIISGGSDALPKNWIGNAGACISCWLFIVCGLGTYVLLVLLILGMLRSFLPQKSGFARFFYGSFMIMTGSMLLFALSPETFASVCDSLGLGRIGAPKECLPGGVVGQVLAAPQAGELKEGIIRRLIGPVGTMVCGWAFLLGGAVMIYLTGFHRFVKDQIASGVPENTRARIAAALAGQDDFDDMDPLPESRRPVRSAGLFSRASHALSALKHKNTSPAEDIDDTEPDEPEEMVSRPFPPQARPEPEAEPVKNTAPANGSFAQSEIPPPAPLKGAEVNTEITEQGKTARCSVLGGYTLPPATMLGKGPETSGEDLQAIVRSKDTLQRTLDSFNVSGQVVGYISGPRVTRYEIQLAPGVPVKKVENLESNIAMDMEAQSVRILAPIPGKNLVGVEAPNSRAEAVYMRSIMETGEWINSSAGIPIVLGKNVAGKPMVLDLAKAPHLLIAGTTGSGKSVCMNTLIMSMIFRFRPDELRLILVDPKIVEFEDYKTLPHLITPVINDSQKVPIALRWAVSEMERRYRVMAKAGVKKLADFNARPKGGPVTLDHEGLPIPDTMPVLVVIVDELADLMMTEAKKDVETSIARIAQKGRAAGIHIVIATQRPSRDIITGVIRANLPTKIAFTVGKRVDSQVILDHTGAETLLGKGDMLFLPPGTGSLERIQGAMVTDEDIKNVVNFVSQQAPQEFNEAVTAEPSEDGPGEGESDSYRNPGGDFDDDDEYSDIGPIVRKYMQPGDGENVRKALEIIIMERKASTSYLQRRLGIGYNKAAELIDLFEARGLVGPQTTGGGKRDVLIFDDIV